jgi:protein associated with RNAse G/E
MNYPISIKSFKHDGSVHRSWYNIFVVENNSEFIIVASIKSGVIEGKGRKWVAREPAITVFPKHKWYNVCCMIRDQGVSYYVNLASPLTMEDGCIKYVDYDLDLKYSYNTPIKYLDINEYRSNSKLMNYDDHLDGILRNTIIEVKKLMIAHKFPFNDNEILKIYNNFMKEQN